MWVLKLRQQICAGEPVRAELPRRGNKVARILIAEDDENIRNLLSSYLRVSGFETDSVADGTTALARVVANRGETSRSFFDIVGPEWDALRKIFNDDLVRARAITRLVNPNQKVADIGTGTGILAIELAQLGVQVIGVDGSTRMLEAARRNLADDEFADDDRVEFRNGDAHALPIADGEVDAAFAHMVFQYLAKPAEALAEMRRIVRPGGAIMLVDFVRHDLEWMREELGVQSLGFDIEQIRDWLERCELSEIQIQVQPPASKNRDIPSSFIASARRPAG